MKTLSKIKSFVIAHKIWTGIIIVALIFIGYKIFVPKASAQTRYVTANVTRGTLVAAITGSGQVSSSNTIDLKPNTSAKVVSINVKPGQSVRKGQTLFVLDAGDAEKTLRDAELNLKMTQNDLQTAKNNYDNTKSSQELSLKNALLALNSDVAAVPEDTNTNTNIVTLSGSYNSTEQGRYTVTAYGCEGGICASYSGLESGNFRVEANVPKPLGTRGLYITFTKVPSNSDKWYIDIPSKTTSSYFTNMQAYTEKQESYKQTLDSAAQNITSIELTVTQRENAIADAQRGLSDYYVAAPFNGTVATVGAQSGQPASSGTALGTIISNQKIATISLNEVDVAKIKLGQKATLTFDAIDGLSIAGEIAEIDSIGTVTQGVVTYTVKISLLTDDSRIKPGMSVAASIIVGTANDVLIAPSSAIKTDANGSYVEMFTPPLPPDAASASNVQGQLSATLPAQVSVEVGISDDINTEIKSGLKEGDQIVSKKITATASKATASSAPSLLGNTSNRGGGGNAFRGAATGR